MRESQLADIIFGKVLRELRLSCVKSLEKLALDSDLERTFISMLELGKRSPTLKSLIALANGLDTPLSEIIKIYEQKFLRVTGATLHLN